MALGLGLLILVASGGLVWMRGDASQAEVVVTSSRTYLPSIYKKYPPPNAFGVETVSLYYPGNYITYYSVGLGSSYTRLNGRISWMDLQPEEGDQINWDLLANFEIELRTLKTAHIVPIVVVDDYPRWATDNTVRDDGEPTACGPLLIERYDEFAAFMQALVSRYSTPEFDVHIWELGNEPDVDPNLVSLDSDYGCWGDWDDPYYNGRAYGAMLQVVTPIIRAADPRAQVWIGGLLLDSPDSDPNPVHPYPPENFFEGILVAGAAPYFDMVSYHAYIGYLGGMVDYDLFNIKDWDSWGGILRGKARFLRAVMEEYKVDKPLFITETSLLCGWCKDYPEILPELYDMQANMPARSFPRALVDDISGFTWYTLNGPGWAYGGLLDELQKPKPVYYAYQTLIDLTRSATLIGQTSIWYGVEVYTYYEADKQIQIMFTVDDITYPLLTPQSGFLAAYDRFGAPLTLEEVDSSYRLNVQFEPIYLVRER